MILIVSRDVCPAHHSGSIRSFNDLNFARAAPPLAAANRNVARKSDLRAAKNRLIFRTRKRLAASFYLNLNPHFIQELWPQLMFLNARRQGSGHDH